MPAVFKDKLIHTVTFDLDDTLWDNKPVIKRAILGAQQLIDQHSGLEPLPMALIADAKAQVIKQTPMLAFDLTSLRTHSYQLALTQHGLNPAKAATLAQAATDEFMRLRTQITPFDTAIPMLKALRENVRVGAISNGNCQLDSLEIGQYFDFWVTPFEASAAKPDPEIYLFSAKEHGFSPESTLHIGDCLTNDIQGANEAGFFTAWFNPEKTTTAHAADAELQCLSDINKTLNAAS